MKATRIKNACYLFLCLSQYKLCVPLSIMICTLRVNYIKFSSYICIMAFWLKSLLCAGIFFSTAFDRGCFNITKWKTNEYVLLSEPKDWLCSVVTVPYVTALFTPAVKLNIFRVITFCLCEYLCILSVFWRKKSPKKLFHNNIASLEGTVELWYLGHWYLEYSDILKFLNSPSSTAYIHKNFTMFL